jgi:ankyrin repeat protein
MKHLLITTIAAVVLVGTALADPIHDAADAGDLAGVQAELDKGVNVNAKEDDYGWTPLHNAADYGHKEIAALLIAKGADVNAKDFGGNTPLDGAEEVSEDDSPEDKAAKKETADLLRKHGGKTAKELKALMPRLVQHGRFAFSFDAKEGKVYEVQDSFDLLNWEVIKTYTGTGFSVRFEEERDQVFPQIYYRVRVVE